MLELPLLEILEGFGDAEYEIINNEMKHCGADAGTRDLLSAAQFSGEFVPYKILGFDGRYKKLGTIGR